ncbi:ROK family transcriptional regulator [Pantoea sp. BAV 3049]|uniref:ROK family transcriptional regulator n=1 Tax=Pantoea sp. BAV 3049 TaxID=2654188 RepID=UPI00131D506F|nr:ROK family transcriptional regulator [Pantoea sp. BAV 3049]
MFTSGLNNQQIRYWNKQLFMRLLWRHKRLSQSRMAQLSGLSIPATGKILQELMDEGRIWHSGLRLSNRGRHSGSYQLPEAGDWTLCMNITPTRIESILADAQLVAQDDYQHRAINVASPEALLTEIEAVWQQYRKCWPSRTIKLALAVHGQVDPVTGVSQHMPQAAWKKPVELKFLLEEKLGVQVRVDNDCVMLALAEKWLNSSHQADFCVINVDYGIGSSFVTNGLIFRGSLYGSGQIGHTIINPHGARCSCGRQGCLETVASLSALKQQAHLRAPDKPAPTTTQLLQAWRSGDRWVQEWVNQAATAVGISLYNLLNIININQIWFYGRSCGFGETWRETVIHQIAFNPFDQQDSLKSKATNIHFGQLSRASQILGIGYLYVEDHLPAG